MLFCCHRSTLKRIVHFFVIVYFIESHISLFLSFTVVLFPCLLKLRSKQREKNLHACEKCLYDPIVYIFGRIIAILINLPLLTTAVTHSNNKPNGNEIFSVIYNYTIVHAQRYSVYFIFILFVRIENDERKRADIY